MSRRDDERLADILASAQAISAHLARGGLDDGLVFDAVRVRALARRPGRGRAPTTP